MPRPLPYASLPTITQLYASSTLVPTTTVPRPLRTIPHLPRTSRFNDTISLYRGDITALPVTAIVNAANSSLLGGGGVDGAIHRAAGRGLLRECRDLDGCETGDAKLTGGHELPAKHVVHAVGPIYSMERDREGTEEKLLSGCYKKALELVSELPKEDEQDDQDLPKLSIAFSGLSTGVYGYPKREAARVAIATVLAWLLEHDGGGFDKVCFCCFEEADYDAYIELLPQFCPLEEGVDQPESEETHDDTEEELPELPSVPTGQLKTEGEPDSKKVKTAHDE